MSVSTYRLRDASGRLLYVGCSKNPRTRVMAHRRKPWGCRIATVEVTDYDDRTEAAIAEYAWMLLEQPPYNRALRYDSRTDDSWRANRKKRGSAKRRLADLLMDGGLDVFVARRRQQGCSWRRVADDIWKATNREIDVTGEAVRQWYVNDVAATPEAASA